ncbi:MAG TPA: ATP-binding cassette domain-containing protein [Longimicrobiales bacterium]|nr:ATP-binding cassette domain-containing protein [Longimicrobiales bacterium]
MNDSSTLFALEHVTAGRVHAVLQDVSWRAREGELWAIVGPNGAGKSSLLALLRQRLPLLGGRLRYGPHARGRAIAADPTRQILLVSLRAQSAVLRGAAGYAQSRWHAGQDDAVARAVDLLGPASDAVRVRRFVDALGLDGVLHRRVTELSNGERRKLLLARAAARGPAVLALDNPFSGLDGRARRSLAEALAELHRGGMTVLVSTCRDDEIPDAATHVLALHEGRAVTAGDRETVLADERFARLVGPRLGPVGRVPEPNGARPRSAPARATPVAELRGVHLTYGSGRVLRGVDWTVRSGERWVVLGPNGAGKSALLSLILADNPQAYANDVSLFGRRRGSGDSIWDIRRRVGWVSPEMHLYHEPDLSTLGVIASAFREGSFHRPTAQELRAAEAWVCALDLVHCRDRRFGDLSEGERQTTLLARALARRPELLVLDEPCQGLDPGRRSRFLDLLERELQATATTLIYVTHDVDEVPSALTHGLLLRDGGTALEGPAVDVLRACAGAPAKR